MPTLSPELPQSLRADLLHAIRTHAVQHGDFILASGKRSNTYVDCRRVTLHGHSSQLIGEALWHVMQPHHPDAVGGVLMGAAPLVTSATVTAASHGKHLDGFLIRKASKGHGMQRLIEGHCQPWMRVVLVEDVVTTGGSVIQGVQQLRHQHPMLDIIGVIALVDRQAGGNEAFANENIPYTGLFTLNECL